jgi:predicted HAD superfamily Cof-like phosphohydrolase
MRELERVREFHRRFARAHPDPPTLPDPPTVDVRIALIEEELRESRAAQSNMAQMPNPNGGKPLKPPALTFVIG